MYEGFAIDTAKQLGQIGFAEFTADLLTSTFEAILDTSLKQQEAYVDMVNELTKPLSTYINETKNEVSGEEVQGFLETLPLFDTSGEEIQTDPSGTNVDPAPITWSEGEEVPPSAISILNQALGIPDLGLDLTDVRNPLLPIGFVKEAADAAGTLIDKIFHPELDANGNIVEKSDGSPKILEATTVKLTDNHITRLYDAVSRRITANKYSLLEGLVRQGMVRLVVDSGVIESRLTFQTYERHEDKSVQKDRFKDRVKTKHKKSSGIFSVLFGGKKQKMKNRSVTVKTAKDYHRDVSGSSVTVYGKVQVNFKSDYLPLQP